MTPEEWAELIVSRWELAPRDAGRDCLKDGITAAIRAAAAEEREACAKMAEAWGPEYGDDFCCDQALDIAAAIRNRGERP